MPPRKKPVRRKKAAPASVGLTACRNPRRPAGAEHRSAGRAGRGGRRRRRRPLPRSRSAGRRCCSAALPVDRVEPTPYQRDASDAHVKRLMGVIETIGRFLDPIVVVREDGQLLHAERQPSAAGAQEARREDRDGAARARSGRRVQDPRAQHREGAQPAREVARDDPHGARAAPKRSDATEASFAFEFEQPAFLTLGTCYEERPRLSGGAYQSILRRVDAFLDEPIAQGDQGARPPRPEDPEAGRCGERGGREAEGARG